MTGTGLLLAAPALFASGDEAGGSGWQLHAAVSVVDFQYKEFGDNGALLDREDGWLPGVVLGFSRPRGEWLFTVEAAIFDGDIDYEGHTTSGVPITTRTSTRIVDLHARAEWWHWKISGWQVAPYGALGYYGWDRDIQPTRTPAGTPVGGVYEYYEWGYAALGAKMSTGNADSRWTADLRWWRTLDPRLSIDFHGLYDRKVLDLGERNGLRLGLAWQHQVTTGPTLSLEAWHDAWALGRSRDETLRQGGVPVGIVYEPKSETRHFGVRAGLQYAF
jgi:hypothetical protein